MGIPRCLESAGINQVRKESEDFHNICLANVMFLYAIGAGGAVFPNSLKPFIYFFPRYWPMDVHLMCPLGVDMGDIKGDNDVGASAPKLLVEVLDYVDWDGVVLLE
jgi:hypothetical protein